MAEKNSPTEKTAMRPFVITRAFDAPRELVWKAWTERQTFDTNHDGMRMGWTGTLDQRAHYLSKATAGGNR